MYLRFVTNLRDLNSHQKVGVFRATWRFEYAFDWWDNHRLDELFAWFDRHLSAPQRWARSRRKYAEKKAICWFKESAEVCMRKAKEIAVILEENGVPIETLITRRPGYIVYEDEHQVAAIPFRDTVPKALVPLARVRIPTARRR